MDDRLTAADMADAVEARAGVADEQDQAADERETRVDRGNGWQSDLEVRACQLRVRADQNTRVSADLMQRVQGLLRRAEVRLDRADAAVLAAQRRAEQRAEGRNAVANRGVADGAGLRRQGTGPSTW